MKFSCDQCNAQYMIADEKVGTKGVKVKCKKCSHIIIVKPVAEAGGTEGSATGAAVGAGGAGMGTGVGTGAGGHAFDAAAGQPSPPVAAPGLGAGAFGGEWDAPTQVSAAAPPAAAGDWGFDAAFSAAAPPAAQPGAPAATAVPSGRPAGDKEWYVAIDDSQVGPIDVGEIEQRWDAGEIDEDSLAWKAGMQDWVPVAEIAELAYLVTERPQHKAASAPPLAAAAGMGMAAGVAASSPGASRASAQLGPLTFGSSDGGESVEWKPSAASALSSLVQEELVAAAQPAAPQQPPPPSPSDMGMPRFGAGELFGGGGGNGGVAPGMAAATPSFGAPPVDFASAGSWSAPKPRDSGGKGLLYAMVGILGVLVLAAGGLGVWFFLVRPASLSGPGAGPAVADASLNSKGGGQAAQQQPEPDKGGEAPAVKGGGDATGGSGVKPADSGHDSGKSSTKSSKSSSKASSRPDKPDKPPARPTVKPPSGPAATNVLGVAEIKQGFAQNARNVADCLKAARTKGELVPGKHTLVLDWIIEPSGAVTSGQLKGPANVLGTSLPGCFAAKMRQWKFPASAKATPIKNFPFTFGMK